MQNALGIKSHDGVTYSTTADRLANQMPSGVAGINHGTRLLHDSNGVSWVNFSFLRFSNFKGIAVDGTVVLLTVTIQQ